MENVACFYSNMTFQVNQGNRIVDEKNFAESNMAIKALEDALREKDQAMERERERFNTELEIERKKRTEFEIQVNNPEEGIENLQH